MASMAGSDGGEDRKSGSPVCERVNLTKPVRQSRKNFTTLGAVLDIDQDRSELERVGKPKGAIFAQCAVYGRGRQTLSINGLLVLMLQKAGCRRHDVAANGSRGCEPR